MAKEDDILNKLGLLFIEINATYSASPKEEKHLKTLFKEYTYLLKARYEV